MFTVVFSLIAMAFPFMSLQVYAEASGKPATVNLSHNNYSNQNNFKLEWNIWWGNNGTSWKLFENNKEIHSATLQDNSPQAQSASFEIKNKAAGTYTYKAEVSNAHGTTTSNTITVTVGSDGGGSDTIAPSAPTNLSSPAQTANTVSLSWTASTDNVGVTGYDVYRGTTKVGTSTSTSYTDQGLTANTSYTYTVKAKDAAGNVSASSNAITVQTKAEDDGGTTPPLGKKIVAYYTAWSTYGRNYQVADIDGSKITHLNYAFANVQNGEIVVGDTYADLDKAFPGDCWEAGCKRGNFNQLQKLKQKYPHLKTLISVGGWTWSGNFSDAAMTEASRTKFANSALKFVREYGFDGVDIDWEYPVGGGLTPGKPEDKQNFTLLMKKLRETSYVKH
jgi:chitinase